MREDRLDIRTYLRDLEEKADRFYRRTLELERELMKAKRIEKVFAELEQHYMALMDSSVFLYFLVSPHGDLLVLNRHAEDFFGVRSDQKISLFSLADPGCAAELDGLLRDALHQGARAVLPMLRGDGSAGWLDVEFAPSLHQGKAVVQAAAVDVSESIRLRSEQSAKPPHLEILNSCPGLLCCAVNLDGDLIYATRGYREVTRRCLGHSHVLGQPYPAGDVPFDRNLREMLLSACIGGTSRLDLIEAGSDEERGWGVTVSPLKDEREEIVGAVVGMAPLAKEPNEPVAQETTADDASSVSFERLPIMAVLVDGTGICVDATPLFFRRLKMESADVLGKNFVELAVASDPQNANLAEKLNDLIRGDTGALECRVGTSSGDLLSLELKSTPATRRGREATLLLCEDKTMLRRTQEQLKRVAATDRTTGVLNRMGMERVLVTELERAARYRGTLSLIVADIDGFRSLNERHGYAASDRMLKALTTALRSRIRATDFLGRWGGDEFMLLTPQPLSNAVQLAETLRDMVRHKTFGEGGGEPISLSFGVAEFEKGMDLGSFVAAAYDAMLESKGRATRDERKQPKLRPEPNQGDKSELPPHSSPLGPVDPSPQETPPPDDGD